MDRSEFIVAIVALLFLVVMGVLLVKSSSQREDKKTECESMSGVYFTPKYGEICIKKDAVITLGQR